MSERCLGVESSGLVGFLQGDEFCSYSGEELILDEILSEFLLMIGIRLREVLILSIFLFLQSALVFRVFYYMLKLCQKGKKCDKIAAE